MSFLINRTPTGRIISLHTEVKYLNEKFGKAPFSLGQMKFDSGSKINQLHFFPLAKKHNKIGLYDPYLDNPLSKAGFHLTQSIQYDSQKSKSVSECMNALEALGWAERVGGGKNKLTNLGLLVASLEYKDIRFFKILRKSLLGYGPFFGFLFKCHSVCLSKKVNVVKKSEVEIGYNNTNETYLDNGRKIPLSTGSQKDSIVRTRAALFAWAVVGGFLWPDDVELPPINNWNISALDIVKNKKWLWSKFKVFIPNELFNGANMIDQPLEYRAMTKSTKALRERGQSEIRRASMFLENKVNNRRFAIVYSLSLCAQRNKKLNFTKLVEKLLEYDDYFVVNKDEFSIVMDKEKSIAIVAGIPFKQKADLLTPLSKINLKNLAQNAPEDVVKILNDIFREISN